MKPLGYAILVGSLALLVWSLLTAYRTIRHESRWDGDTTRYFTQEDVARAEARRDTVWHDSMAVITAGLVKVAERNKQTSDHLDGVVDSLLGVLAEATTPQESTQTALQALETMRGSRDSLLVAFVALEGVYRAQQLQLVRLKLENQRAWNLIDSASAVIRRVPSRCKVPLIPIPCPRLVAGYGVGPAGLGPFAGVAVSLN